MTRQILDESFWLEKREIIRNSYEYNEHWAEILDKFKKRIYDFYFHPIDRVKDPNKLKGEGFTILTIQCALIEMFSAFKLGKIHNFAKRGEFPSYEYKKADECFISFLHSESIFENHFYTYDEANNKQTDLPFNAKEFYNCVRCGLMHEARLKGNWVVNAKRKYSITDNLFIKQDSERNKVSIDRTLLNKQLKSYFSSYLEKLSNRTIEGQELRRLFARKLDHLYNIPEDSINFDWWEDR